MAAQRLTVETPRVKCQEGQKYDLQSGERVAGTAPQSISCCGMHWAREVAPAQHARLHSSQILMTSGQ